MIKKLLFFDIDGTLLTEDTYEIPESTKKAIKIAREKGNLAFINTGRTVCNLEEEITSIGFDGYVCGCGTYIQAGENILLEKSIADNVQREIICLLRECNVEAVLEGKKDIYFDTLSNPSERMKALMKGLQSKGLGSNNGWDDENISFDKFYCITSGKSNMEKYLKYLKKEFEYIDRGKGCGEVVPKGYSKGKGIGFLLDYYSLSVDNAYVFGDSTNDLPMLKYVKHSVAMGNACEEVKKSASFITKDIKDDGIYYALQKLSII